MTTPILQIDLRDRRTGAVSRHVFHEPGQLRLGRDPACDLCLADPTVSSVHAAIELDGTTAYLRDLGSTNGFHIAGRRVPPRLKVRLVGRIHVDIGPFHLEIAHRPNPAHHDAHGSLPSSSAPDLDLLHTHLVRLHALHAPLAAARAAFETALADAALALAPDPAAVRRLHAEFPSDFSLAPSTHDLSFAPAHDPLTPSAPDLSPGPARHDLSLAPSTHDLSLAPSTPDLSLAPSTHDLSLTPSINDLSPGPTRPDLSLAPSTPDLSPGPARPDLSLAPPTLASAAPAPPRTSAPDPSTLTPAARSYGPPAPAATDLSLGTPDPRIHPLTATSSSTLALLAPLARAVLPGERPPATADEARRFLDRLARVLRDLAAGLAALQHLRIQQLRSFDLTAGGPENPVLSLTRGDELLAHLLAWRSATDTTAHELMDCFAVLLAHLRGHAHAALSTACHVATHLAPPEIERETRARGPLRTFALWRTFRDRYTACVGDIGSLSLKDTFKNSYRAELAELGVHLTQRQV